MRRSTRWAEGEGIGTVMPFEVLRGAPAAVLFVADHASNRVPAALGDLGVPAADMARHIAWDIGTDALTRALVATVGGAAVLSRVSRLVIDKNRDADHPGLVQAVHGCRRSSAAAASCMSR